ncbi:MAG: hypothetical protein US94_C0003G0016 [Berkelbacteria bacterium GW2011_GWB1_38_5]|uniref:NHL repeat containing protein n=2 Tax=Candidatus Berkelbacteria TaxID=1618330 RepID=A0A0G0NYY1_9BACT|nr:MAG: hypothetical protein US94_C0003G0016 [Berkelbacteria bacterium GW2011_GWB1_38_5]KKQ91064.1 MAG: hypothetical protein UT15_C0001G0044 [Berkelbacteria bacterium GW2011_GWA1_39_10]
MAYEIQFARVTNSGKLSDRFLTCKHITADDLAKFPMGQVFSLIEIISPWFPTAQVGQTIINNFSKYYYEGGSTSDLVNLENSLKKVNEDLAQITQNGETDWIGNLNGILAVIAGNNFHLSPTGKVEGYIFRDGKINHLTYGLQDSGEPHPLKTFSNVVSGELKSHDKILLTTKELFNHLSLESVRQIISINNPSMAAQQISKLLRKNKIRNVNIIIINLLTKEEVSNEQAFGEMENVYYLDKTTEGVMGKINDIWKSFLVPFGKIIKHKSKDFGKKTSNLTKNIVKEPITNQEPVGKQDDAYQEFLDPDKRDDSLLKDEEIKYSPELYVHYYDQKKNKQNSFFDQVKNVLFKIWLKLKQFFTWIIDIYHDKARRKYLYIALAVILILIIGLVVGLKNKKSPIGNLDAQKILDEASAAEKDGKNAVVAGDKEKAKAQFIIAIDKAKSIKSNSLVARDADQVIISTYQELDKLTSTTRFNTLTSIANIADAKSIFVVSGIGFIITDKDIYEVNTLGGTPSKVATIPKNKNYLIGTRQEKIIYLYTSDQNIYSFNTSTKKIEQVKITDDNKWETANSIASYVGTFYLLDGVLGQIYKHSSSADEFQKGEEYINTTNINLKSARSIAIDGSIYVLKENGQAVKLLKSKVQDFSLQNIPTPNDKIAEPIKIFTDADTPSVYVLDGAQKRIVEFDKDGYFVRQYAFLENIKYSDFFVSVKARKIWLIGENNLYEISI